MACSQFKLFLIFLCIVIGISSCNKDKVDLKELLESQQWYIAYYRVEKGDLIYYATDHQYRIQFRSNQQIAVFKQSGDVEYGDWSVENDEILNIKMNRLQALSGQWELIKYYVWGYDQDRFQLRYDTIEIGLY
jgi:hypothetical protein